MKLSDEKLQYAAKLAAKAELEPWLDYEAYEEPVFSEKFQQRMQALIENVRVGNVAQDRARLGWQYYSRRGLAAVLLCFLLSCVAMPEAVMAGCRKVIEVVRTVYEEYTEYHFTSREKAEAQLTPLTFGYLPDSLHKNTEEITTITYFVDYVDSTGRIVFSLEQDLLTENMTSTYIADTEDANVKYGTIKGREVKKKKKKERIQFVWIYEAYCITGQTRLPEEEILRILQNIEL